MRVLLTKQEVMMLYGVCHKTVERWTQNGMPTRKAGPHRQSPVRYEASKINRWIMAHYAPKQEGSK